MTSRDPHLSARRRALESCLAAVLLSTGLVGGHAVAEDGHARFKRGNLLVSRLVYDNNPANVVAGATLLPPGCDPAVCVVATDSGAYPYVWNNVLVDENFGVTSKIVLDQLTPAGSLIGSLDVPNGSEPGVRAHRDQMVGSFSSKSEGALNLSTDGRYVTFMGYLAPVDALDISNSNTPGVVDPTDPVALENYRVVGAVDRNGRFAFTKTNAYSGNNGRAVIMNSGRGTKLLYGSGNAGNGSNPQPDGIIVGAGAQILAAADKPLVAQHPGLPTPLGSFSITQLGYAADKIGKDTNFRGLTIFDNVVYYTKGSGGNGINTVYFVDTTGSDASGKPFACPTGSGLPTAGANLPTAPLQYDPSQLQTRGLVPYNMCILNGLPTAKKSKTFFPFGLWFADAKTLYVADEGKAANDFDATTGRYPDAAAQAGAGLQKWVFDAASGAWKLAYTLQAGLDLGVPYTVAGYPTGNNPRTGVPWSPATQGLRNITGRVNRDGTVTIWAITSTVSGNGDQGADPNKLVMITDDLAATSLPAAESFRTLRTARFGEALRGVSFTPGTEVAERDDHGDHHDHDGR